MKKPLQKSGRGETAGLGMLTILYGSQTGTAEELAFRLGREASKRGFAHTIFPMDDYNTECLADGAVKIFLCSTTGEGEEPDNMKGFWRFLRRKDLPPADYNDLHFAVFGLGDSSYELFNWAGKKLYRRLLQLGAKAVVDRGDGDDQHRFGVDGAFGPWLEGLWTQLANHVTAKNWILRPISDPSPSIPIHLTDMNHHLDIARPVTNATIIFNERITSENDQDIKDVRHIRFSCDLPYDAGDVAVLRPVNSDTEVDAALSALGIAHLSDQTVCIGPSSSIPKHVPRHISVKRLFKEFLDLNRPPSRYFFEVLSRLVSPNHPLAEAHHEKLLELGADLSEVGLDSYLDYAWRPKRKPAEVLLDFQSVKIPFEWILELFPWIKSRSFSIASYAPGERVDVVVALVRYKTIMAEERVGLCSQWLESIGPDAQLQVSINTGSMRPAINPQIPLVLLCSGTGIAPMLSIIEKISLASERPPVYLFFGCRKRSGDALFINELAGKYPWVHCFCVGSRDGPKGVAKAYLADILRQNSDLVAELLLHPQSQWYLSGNSKLPASVKKALGEIADSRLPISGSEFIQRLVQNRRFHSETWS